LKGYRVGPLLFPLPLNKLGGGIFWNTILILMLRCSRTVLGLANGHDLTFGVYVLINDKVLTINPIWAS